MGMLLLTLHPRAIQAFCHQHPIQWVDTFRPAGVAYADIQRGGRGDIMSPTPCADVFFKQLQQRHGALMTQAEYAQYACQHVWRAWYDALVPIVQQCFMARLYHNFYPSFIDSLYVWAVLSDAYYFDGRKVFDRCVIDTVDDVISKTDLLLYREGQCLRVALMSNSRESRQASLYKQRWRGHVIEGTVFLPLDMRKQKGIGNKRWYEWPQDFAPLCRRAEQLWLFSQKEGDS